jgi:hypothetical protein
MIYLKLRDQPRDLGDKQQNQVSSTALCIDHREELPSSRCERTNVLDTWLIFTDAAHAWR